ncbi:MAG TPA: HAD-IB family hydrolase [Candidatus Paceibacterota bacterium]|jgi:HAD superfamily hydrolase (TIGR01490 family)
MKPVAIFDIDGTIFRSSLLVELVEMLIDEGFFPASSRKKYEREYHTWVDRKGDYEHYISAVVRTFMQDMKGVRYADFATISERVVELHKDRVYRYTRDLVCELHKDGYYLLAISQSPKTVLESFCKRLGFHKVYGRIYEIGPEDQFTGNIIDQHLIENKANIVRRAIEKEGLTLTNSVGVGDTEGDVAFLELVERPIAFNPNQKLFRHAKRLGWKVVVERKDVIYEIGP